MSKYQHEFVDRLETFVEEMLSLAKQADPMVGAILMGFVGQVPMMLSALDQDEEKLNWIMNKLACLLGVEDQPEFIIRTLEQPTTTESAEAPQDTSELAAELPEAEEDGTDIFGPPQSGEEIDQGEPPGEEEETELAEETQLTDNR